MVVLSVKDRKILQELEIDARQPALTIGKKLGMGADVVQYRINKLEKEGVLKFYLCYVNIAKLGYIDFGLYLSTHHMSISQEKEFVKFMQFNKNVSYFSKVGGSYDFIIGMLSTDPITLYALVSEINTQFENLINKIDIITRIKVSHFPKRYLIEPGDKTKNSSMEFGGIIEHEKLDALDVKIIANLNKNAREKIINIATELKQPHSTISTRLKQLQKRKIIQGCFAWIEPQSYGYESYNLLIRMSRTDEKEDKRLFNFCQRHPHITWNIKTLGLWDYEIGVETQDQRVLQEVISELKEEMGATIQRVEFVTIFNTLKYVPYPLA